MRLQDVIKEREAEITVLESTLKDKDSLPVSPQPAPEASKSAPLTNGDATIHLSPKTMSQFSEIRKSLDLHHSASYTDSDVDESLVRLNELMRYVYHL